MGRYVTLCKIIDQEVWNFNLPKDLDLFNFSLLELGVSDWVWNRGLCMQCLHCRNILQLHRSSVCTHWHRGIKNLPSECTWHSLSYSLALCTLTKYVSRVLISQLCRMSGRTLVGITINSVCRRDRHVQFLCCRDILERIRFQRVYV